jgi:hypothetical protein
MDYDKKLNSKDPVDWLCKIEQNFEYEMIKDPHRSFVFKGHIMF